MNKKSFEIVQSHFVSFYRFTVVVQNGGNHSVTVAFSVRIDATISDPTLTCMGGVIITMPVSLWFPVSVDPPGIFDSLKLQGV
jgi:hypothetical protein